MRLDTGQQMRMDQRMKLDPRMIQSMEILQMPMPALEERIEQELASNPTLELSQSGPDNATLERERKQAQRDDTEGERPLVVQEDPDGKHSADDFERLSNISEQYGDSWDANTSEGSSTFARNRVSSTAGDRDGKMDAMANAAARGMSLYDQLSEQWHLTDADEDIRALGDYVIGMIDADGYLRVTDAELLEKAPAKTTAEGLSETINTLKRVLEPTGLCARDLRDCLLMQIDARASEDKDIDLSAERMLVEGYLKDIEENRYPKIAKSVGKEIDVIQRTVQNLRQFHPHPGRLLASESVRMIRPDAVIEFDEENDSYTATLTQGSVGPLTISRDYEDMAKDKGQDKQTREFVMRNLNNARFLLDAIQQRRNTLLRVIGVVVNAQRDFFEQGQQALRPLPMTTVADQLGVHISTISRAVSEKYLQTPQGIVPLRMFFSGGADSADGEAMAWGAIQAKLKQVIDGEDKSKPLSDDQLVTALKNQGVSIARRTVAKYRKVMNIPAARQRRQY